MITVVLDTKTAGRRAGELKARLGGVEAVVPVVASVAGRREGQPRVLVVSSGFGSYSHRADHYRPWFDLVREAGLDVSYMESGHVPMSDGRPPAPGSNLSPMPEELARYDVILLADGGVVHLNANTSLAIAQFADTGKRVILMASPALGDTVLRANRILEPIGMRMVDRDVWGSEPGYPRIEAAPSGDDKLLEGVKKLTAFRPAPIRILDPSKARILARINEGDDGFVAVSRMGRGEIVAIGLVDLPSWLGERGRGTDNARFLRNLLTARVRQR